MLNWHGRIGVICRLLICFTAVQQAAADRSPKGAVCFSQIGRVKFSPAILLPLKGMPPSAAAEDRQELSEQACALSGDCCMGEAGSL